MFRYLLSIICLFIAFSGVSQSHIIQEEYQTYGQEVFAWDSISLRPGFKYNPTEGNQHHLFIDENGIKPIGTVEPDGTYKDLPIFPKDLKTDPNTLVGNKKGAFSVDGLGGANYFYPLEVHPGLGLSPNIAIAYNSNKKGGVAGEGWGLQGMESITVGNYSWETDGHAGSYERYTGDGPFYLNGVRIVKNGYYSWVPVMNDYSVISSIGSTIPINGFSQKTKSGLEKIFGGSDEYILRDENNTPVMFLLDKIIDNHGREIDYKYEVKDNVPRLIDIFYGRNVNKPNSSNFVQIKFRYKERKDIRNTFFHGIKQVHDYLLDEIICYVSDDEGNKRVSNKWKFSYFDETAFRTFLDGIQESTTGGKSFNSLDFLYDIDPQDVDLVKSSDYGNSDRSYLRRLDLNGDGFDDWIQVYYNTYYSGQTLVRQRVPYIRTLLNSGTGSAYPSELISVSDGGEGSELNKFGHDVETGDFNGDGFDDFLVFKWEKEGDKRYLHYALLYTGSINGLTGTMHSLDLKDKGYKLNGGERPDGYYSFADYNQNGSIDIVFSGTGNGAVGLFFHDFKDGKFRALVGNKIDNSERKLFNYFRSNLVLDMDGDGYKDILAGKSDGTYDRISVEFPNGPTSKPIIKYKNIQNFTSPGAGVKRYFGDFNGDGVSDYFEREVDGPPYYDQRFRVVLGKGNGDFEEKNIGLHSMKEFIPEGQWGPIPAGEIVVGDYNGDGRSDIAVLRNGRDNGIEGTDVLSIMFFNGHVLGNNNYWDVTVTNKNLDFPWSGSQLINGNFLGLDREALAVRKANSGHIHVFSVDYNHFPRKLIAFSDALKNIWEIDYLNYQWENFELAPSLFSLKSGLSVVNQLRSTDLFGDKSRIRYDLLPIFYHPLKGIVGKEENSTLFFKQEESVPIKTMIANSIWDENILKFLPHTSLETSASTLVKTFKSFFSVKKESANNSFEIFSLGGEQHNYLSGTDVVTTIKEEDYDNFGNLTFKTTTVTNAEGTFVTEETMGDFVNGGSWIPSFPQSVSKTQTLNTQAPITILKNLTYTSSGQVKTITEFAGDSHFEKVTTNYFNGFGQLYKTIVDPISEEPRTNYHVEYSESGRFVEKIFNDIDVLETQVLETDPIWAIPTLIKNKRTGDEISKVLNSVGQVVEVLKNDTSEKTSTLAWELGDGSDGIFNHGRKLFKTTSWHRGVGTEEKLLDLSGKVLFSASEIENNGMSTTLNQSFEYHPFGEWVKSSEPYMAGNSLSAFVQSEEFDENGRKSSYTNRAGTTVYDYNLNEVTITSPSKTVTQKMGPMGEVVSTTDDLGYIETVYNSYGKPLEVKVNEQIVDEMAYYPVGLQLSLDNIDAGNVTYKYNGFGELEEQTIFSGTKIVEYDTRGRKERLTDNGLITDYSYFPIQGDDRDRLLSIAKAGYEEKFLEYSKDGLVEEKEFKIEGRTFTKSFEYDEHDRLKIETFPNGVQLKYEFSEIDGSLNGINSVINGDSKSLISDVVLNSSGQVESYILANGFKSKVFYDGNKNPERFTASTGAGPDELFIQDYGVDFDPITGNCMERTDYTKEVNGSPLKEVFGYDNDRLINWKVGSLPLKSVSYEINGNIKNKSDVSGNDYMYHPTRKHAVNNVNNGSADLKKHYHSIQYNVNNAPSSIASDDGSVSLNYLYGLGDERVKSQLVKGGTTVSKYYLGNYEVVNTNGVEHSIIYVSFPGTGLIAMLVTTDQSTEVFPVYKDHLGSITKITNLDGDIVAEHSFDPWGRRRDPNTWDINQPIVGNGLDWLHRGYTGHEMLDDFDIIHMNGRLYDPLTARMLSPDNFVQSPSNSQNYNRYSYVLNNPLKYTDPDGEVVVAAFIIGAVISGAVGYVNGKKAGLDGRNLAFYTAASGVIGGVSGGVGAGVTSAVSITAGGFIGGFVSGFAGGASGGFIAGTFTSVLSNTVLGTNQNSFKAGINGAIIGGFTGGIINGLSEGIAATKNGQRFFDGAYINDEVIIDQNIPIVKQIGENDCYAACLESVDESYGGNMKQTTIRGWQGGNKPLKRQAIIAKYSEKAGRQYGGLLDSSFDTALSELNHGGRVIVSKPVGGGMDHAVVINKVTKRTFTKLSGKVVSRPRYIINVMNPKFGQYQNVRPGSFFNTVNYVIY